MASSSSLCFLSLEGQDDHVRHSPGTQWFHRSLYLTNWHVLPMVAPVCWTRHASSKHCWFPWKLKSTCWKSCWKFQVNMSKTVPAVFPKTWFERETVAQLCKENKGKQTILRVAWHGLESSASLWSLDSVLLKTSSREVSEEADTWVHSSWLPTWFCCGQEASLLLRV